jgi:hypothetical protein
MILRKKTKRLLMWTAGAAGLAIGIGFIIKKVNEGKTAKQAAINSTYAVANKNNVALSTYVNWK